MGAIKKISICHMASGDLWAGAEAQIAASIASLTKYKDLRISAILYNSGILADRLHEIGIPVQIFEEDKLNPIKLLSSTRKVLCRERPDLLHVHRYKENILGSFAARLSGVKSVVRTVHGMSEPFTGFKKIKASFYGALNNWFTRRGADSIIAVSHDIRRQLIKTFPRINIVTIHNGIDPDQVRAAREPAAIRAELGIPAGDFVIGSVGRLTPVKAYHNLLKAHKLLLRKMPETTLVIAGDGPERFRLESLSRELMIDKRSVFPGFVRDVADYLGIFDIFTLSSLHEGISISLLEALALGVPAVVTNVGGNPEVVTDGETGLLAPAGNPEALAEAYAKILADKELREQMGNNGPGLIANHFSMRENAEKIRKLYHSIKDD